MRSGEGGVGATARDPRGGGTDGRAHGSAATDDDDNRQEESRHAVTITVPSMSPRLQAVQPASLLLPSSLLPLSSMLEDAPSPPISLGSSSLGFGGLAVKLLETGSGVSSSGGVSVASLMDSPIARSPSGLPLVDEDDENDDDQKPGGWLDGFLGWVMTGVAHPTVHDQRGQYASVRTSGDSDVLAGVDEESLEEHLSPASASKSHKALSNRASSPVAPSLQSSSRPARITSHGTQRASSTTSPTARALAPFQTARCDTLSRIAVIGMVCIFFLFLVMLGGEYFMDARLRSSNLDQVQLSSGDGAAQPDFDPETVLALRASVVRSQKEVNYLLRQSTDRASTIHELQAELATRDEVLTSYRKVVQRLKALQTEHAEMDRKVREEAAAHINTGALTTPSVNVSAAGAIGGVEGIDLSQYKAKLMRLIFGNRTLEESRREHDRLQEAQANEYEILRLVREQSAAGAANRGGVGDMLRGATELKVDTVMRVQELDSHGGGGDSDDAGDSPGGSDASKAAQAPADRLIDRDQNEYILSKPGDSSQNIVDTRLVLDLGIVIVASAIGGLAASAAKQPILLGYLCGGCVIGPGGARLIGQFIQIETLAQFGATFLLFALGVEFSISKLRRVKHIAFIGGGLQLVGIMIAVAAIGVYALDLPLPTAAFIGAVLSMSSTTVVVKSLMERKQIATLCGQVMLGLLIVQDLFLSLMLALLHLAQVPMHRLASESLWLAGKFCVLAAIVLICMKVWPICLRLLDQSKSQDLFLLGLVAMCVFLTVVSENIIHSAEVGAFLSGILISSSPGTSSDLTHRSLRLFGPIRDMFGALFFCSIGMLIDPVFLVEKAASIITVVIATIILKSTLTFVIVRLFGYTVSLSLRTGLGLSQVGEFAFVLSSEGLALGLITSAQYQMLVAATALSLFVTPSAFHCAEWAVKRFKLEDRKAHAAGGTVD